MKRILIHAGFHKTGTTHVQQTLHENRQTLRRTMQIFLRRNMQAACETARAWSASRAPEDLALFAAEIAELFSRIDTSDDRPVLISSEDLSGHMPGRHGLTTYDAAPTLMRTIAEVAPQALSVPHELIFYFSTRAPEPWLHSCYGQHLRATRLTDDFATYCATHGDSAAHGPILDELRLAVDPHKVLSCPLEKTGDRPLGPLAPLLDALAIPGRVRRRISRLPPANVSLPDDILTAFLEANRSDLPDADVARLKTEARRIYLTGVP